MKLEYVASGVSNCRLTNLDVTKSQELIDVYRDAIGCLKRRVEHEFSFLYNAFTESDFPQVFESYKDILYNIHADSGGLQMLTTSENGISPTTKKKIYKNQADFSDVAMCFDEIPAATSGEKSRTGNITDRFFTNDTVDEKAKATGRNVRDQIEVFLDRKSNAKPMVIVHGNDYDSFMRWTEMLMTEIPVDYQKYIGGAAISGAVHGSGLLEDAWRAFVFKNLPMNTNNHLHVLGIGVPRRLLPFICFHHSGFFDKDLHLSYDSTTHTKGINLGKYFLTNKTVIIGRPFNKMYKTVFDDLMDGEWFDEDYKSKVDVKEFHKIMNSTTKYYISKKTKKKFPDRMRIFYKTKAVYLFHFITNFMTFVDKITASEKDFYEYAGKYQLIPDMYSLSKVKNYEDMKHWASLSGKIISKKIGASAPATLFL